MPGDLFVPYPAGAVEGYQVTPRVNRAGYEAANAIEPIRSAWWQREKKLETGQAEAGPDGAPGHGRCRGQEAEAEVVGGHGELHRRIRPIKTSSPDLSGDGHTARNQGPVRSDPYHVDHHRENG